MKASHVATLLLFVVAAVAGFDLFGQGGKQAPHQRWEYHSVRESAEVGTVAKLGQDGWELVSVVHLQQGSPTVYYYFKRPSP